MAKTKDNIQLTNASDKEKDTKVKSSTKKTKKVETEKIEKIDNVQVDVEIDCRSCNHSDVVGGYIRHKRSI